MKVNIRPVTPTDLVLIDPRGLENPEPALSTLSRRIPVTSTAVMLMISTAVFFLGAADLYFAFRVHGANIRVANVLMAAAVFLWLWRRARQARAEVADLAVAWLPFFCLYAVAIAMSESPLPGWAKLGWFAVNFFGAYCCCSLLGPVKTARGYFVAFLAIAAIIVFDFLIGFTEGPEHMIGYGQRNDMLPGVTLYRPHAFYYEPSFAATGLGLAWALAMTRMGGVRPWLATALVGVGTIALLLTTSRTGWLYSVAVLVAMAVLVPHWRAVLVHSARWKGFAASVMAAVLLSVAVIPPEKRGLLFGLADQLGSAQTLERICPLLEDRLGFGDLDCLSGEQRAQFLGKSGSLPPGLTGEGWRVMTKLDALDTIARHPWTGIGVGAGTDRLIAPPKVANVWLEIAVEAGVVAALAFAWGLAFTMYRWKVFERRNRTIAIAVVLLFLVSWQFLQTFPRLDIWLGFWAAMVFARSEAAGVTGGLDSDAA
jgi:hypothetical protein